jgi:CelD/BcsL family acetyltransferase involved in cellulose biosynthesis
MNAQRQTFGILQLSDVPHAAWLAALDQTQFPSPLLHPQVLQIPDATTYALFGGSDDPWLAFFREGAVPIIRLPLLAKIPGIRVHRLLEGGLLGAATSGRVERLAKASSELIMHGCAPAMLFESIPIGGELWRALLRCASEPGLMLNVIGTPQPHWYLDMPNNFGQYWQSFSAKSRKNLGRLLRSFQHTLHHVSKPSEVPALVEQLAMISSRSWQAGRIGLRIKSDDATRRHLAALASIGALRSYILEHEGSPVAFILGTQYRGRFIVDEMGFDASLRSASPGRILCLLMIQDLLNSQSPLELDFGTGDAAYKQYFGTRHQVVASVVLARHSVLRGAVVCTAVFLERSIRRATQAVPLYPAIRRWYRRGPRAR